MSSTQHNTAQEEMRLDYNLIEREYSNNARFKTRLKQASEAGLLLFVKYALVIILAFFAINYFTQLQSGATNGTQSALYLAELQSKGWLPKIVNGAIPPKLESEVGKKE